jgi:hypothetical protein
VRLTTINIVFASLAQQYLYDNLLSSSSFKLLFDSLASPSVIVYPNAGYHYHPDHLLFCEVAVVIVVEIKGKDWLLVDRNMTTTRAFYMYYYSP